MLAALAILAVRLATAASAAPGGGDRPLTGWEFLRDLLIAGAWFIVLATAWALLGMWFERRRHRR
jgi:hypothetical protein